MSRESIWPNSIQLPDQFSFTDPIPNPPIEKLIKEGFYPPTSLMYLTMRSAIGPQFLPNPFPHEMTDQSGKSRRVDEFNLELGIAYPGPFVSICGHSNGSVIFSLRTMFSDAQRRYNSQRPPGQKLNPKVDSQNDAHLDATTVAATLRRYLENLALATGQDNDRADILGPTLLENFVLLQRADDAPLVNNVDVGSDEPVDIVAVQFKPVVTMKGRRSEDLHGFVNFIARPR